MNLLAYLRLSKDDRGDAPSIDTQRHLTEKWAAEHGHKILGFYTDRNVSGGTAFEERPGWSRLWQDVKLLKADGVVCLCLDRFVRDLRHQLNMLFEMGSARISLHFVQHSFDDSPEGWLMMQVYGMFAEWFRRTIARKVKDRQTDLHAQGLWSCSRPPLGYLPHGKGIILLDEARASDLAAVFSTYMQCGGNRGITATALNSLGIRTRDGGLWNAPNVARTISNPLYRGYVRYKGKELPAVGLPEAIPIETAEAAFALFKSTTKHKSRNTHTWIYSGWLTCVKCGRRYIGHAANGGRTYLCRGKGIRECDAGGLSERIIDGMVGRAVQSILVAHEKSIRSAKRPQEKPAKRRDDTAARQRLVDLFEAGIITREELLRRLEKYQPQAEPEIKPALRHDLPADMVAGLARHWPSMTREEKRALLALVVKDITLDVAAKTIHVRSDYITRVISVSA